MAASTPPDREFTGRYAFGSIGLDELAAVCGDRPAVVIAGRLLIGFRSVADRDLFESCCRNHSSPFVRDITRLPDPPLPEQPRAEVAS